MSESGSRSNLVKALSSLDAVAIESPSTGLGIPDVNYTRGWIECKWMRSWPKNADTRPVKFDHTLSQEQKIWMYRRAQAGGLVHVCAQVSRSWFFFPGGNLLKSNWWDNMTRPEMIEMADFYCPNGLEKERLIQWLKSL